MTTSSHAKQINTDTPYEIVIRPRAVLAPDGRVRHLVVNIDTQRLCIAPGLYAAHLQAARRSPNTIRNVLVHLAHLYSWSEKAGINADVRLLQGQGFLPREIRAFSYALSKYAGHDGQRLKSNTIAGILLACRVACGHFISQYRACLKPDLNVQKVELASLLAADAEAWRSVTPRRIHEEDAAPDLTDAEIAAIEHFLTPATRIAAGEWPEIAYRNYLLWRLCIGLGLRLGEALALRLQDCERELICIVRVQDRTGSSDPRGTHAPRPKTLGRELGVLTQDPLLPQLISHYGAMYRYYRRHQGERTTFDWDPPHDYLLLDHKSGHPLSVYGAEYVARKIRRELGFPYHWHLARHAFFNRMYDAGMLDENKANRETLISDMQYWGGWRSRSSVYIYTKRAVADRARGKIRARQESL